MTPAVVPTKPGAVSDSSIVGLDANHQALDGAKAYPLHLVPNLPPKDNWSVTIYDTETRSLLLTDRQYAGINSCAAGLQEDADTPVLNYFAPKARRLRGWRLAGSRAFPARSGLSPALRAHRSPLAWIDKTWRPSDMGLLSS